MMTMDQFFRLEKGNHHDHIHWFNKFTSTIKYRDVPNSVIKLILFPFSLARAARRWLEKEPPRSITTWEDLVSKFINELFPLSRTTNLRNEISNFQQRFDESFHEAWGRYKDLLRACPHHGFTELHQLATFYNALNPADQDSLNAAAGGNLLEISTQDVLTINENKSKVRNSQSKPIVSQVKAYDVNSNSETAKLTYAVNQQTSAMTTAMTAMLKQFQATPPPAPVKAVEEFCVTCGGAHPYYQCLAAGGNTFSELRDNIQGYVSAAAVNYNQGNPGYRPQGIANQIRPPGFAQPNVQNNQNRFGLPQGFNRGNNFNHEQSYQATAQQNQNFHFNELEKIKRMNEANIKAMQTQIDMVKNELRNEMKSSIQTSLSNQTNEIKNVMASLLQMNTASGSGSLPSNTVASTKGELKAITTRIGLLLMDQPFPLLPNPLIRRSSSRLTRDQTSNPTSSTNTTPKGHTRRSSKQKFENSNFKENLPPVATMADNRTIAEMLRAPTEGCAEAIVAWERYKDLLRACPHHCFTESHQLDTFYNALNPADQDSLNAAAGGNLLEKSPQDALTIIENKSKVRNSQSNSIASQVKACDINSSSEIAKLTHAVNQQTSAGVANQMRPPGFAQPNVQNNQNQNLFSPPQGFNRGSGSLPSNTVANPKGELKDITTRSGLVTDGPTVPTPPKSVTPEA
nr:reverse transcriptase domain-containing protein [Tanacetum cinerariifolium]